MERPPDPSKRTFLGSSLDFLANLPVIFSIWATTACLALVQDPPSLWLVTRPAKKPGPGGVGGGSKVGRRKRQSPTTSTWNLKDRTVKDALGKCLYQAKVGSVKKGMSRDVFGDLMKGYLCGEIEVLNGTVANLTSCPGLVTNSILFC